MDEGLALTVSVCPHPETSLRSVSRPLPTGDVRGRALQFRLTVHDRVAKPMRTDLFDFELPAGRIALRPASQRDSARMFAVPPDGAWRHQIARDLPQRAE